MSNEIKLTAEAYAWLLNIAFPMDEGKRFRAAPAVLDEATRELLAKGLIREGFGWTVAQEDIKPVTDGRVPEWDEVVAQFRAVAQRVPGFVLTKLGVDEVTGLHEPRDQRAIRMLLELVIADEDPA